ncbi:recombinase-like zinc beta ribbon protein [Natranaerovirga hydrolytica]|uniref:Recombinase-like zinc beta ribbon protein n=1 Tax=Natranaerovirga hydrolytica TaxID=680378 RepID=A0A4R1MC62_9FIRM|nr:recombinase family protein [Natranaerovirga hydrolytica]TCK89110.1 recombinase-like zinc beta ribbon protein [Natranaerovirga hydrolytica]
MQRHMPMGYRMGKGKVFLEEEKARVVRKVFADYLSGISTHAIAKELTAKGIPNANNKPSWNHGSVGRILENIKYLGDEMYPQMIESEVFEQVQNRREEQRQRLGRVKQPNNINSKNSFSGRVWCGECGEVFRKYVENRGRPSEKSKWRCKHYIYKNRVRCIGGAVTEEQIKEVFILAVNRIIKTPSLLEKKPKKAPKRYPPEFLKLDQRIKELEAGQQFSSKELATLIFQRAEAIYQTAKVKDYEHHTENMRQALSGKELQTGFDEELFLQTVKGMIVYTEGQMDVEFINGLTLHETYK